MTDWLEPHVVGGVETASQQCEVSQPVNICVGTCYEFRHSIGFSKHGREHSLIICNFAPSNWSLIEVFSPILAKSQLPNNIR